MKKPKKIPLSDSQVELLLHEALMHDLLDDLGAPRHPDNDTKRPPFGTYGRLKAYAESIGIKASIWESKDSSAAKPPEQSRGGTPTP
jgi:hypothetical protein